MAIAYRNLQKLKPGLSIPVVLFILSIALLNRPSYAKEAKSKRKGRPDGLSIGASGIYRQSPYKGVGYEFIPIPMLGLKYRRFTLDGPRARFSLLKKKYFSLALTSEFRGIGNIYEAEDSVELAGMERRKGTLYAGGRGRIRFKGLSIGFNGAKDVLGVHNGHFFSGSLGAGLPISVFIKKWSGIKNFPFILTGVSGGLIHYDETFVNYHFGVKANEARSDRPAYTTSSSTSKFFRGSISINFKKHWMAMAMYQREFFGAEIKNSPIVDESEIYRIFFGLSYTFLWE